jgi:microsomal dipeptidase-like Zn-dependent dipeptidase
MLKRQIALTVGVVSAIIILTSWSIAGRYTDVLAKNRVLQTQHLSCQSEPACQRYREMFIVDAHADTLLHRNPARPSKHGHVDLSRLLGGGVDLQVFAMAPFAPSMQALADEVCGSETAANRIAGLFVVKEPLRPSTWFSLHARVLRMIDQFDSAMKPEPGEPSRFIPVREAEDLERLIVARGQGEPVVGALLSVEGFYWASTNREVLRQQLRELQQRGVRMISLTQRASSSLAGSSEDCDDPSGLTDTGRFAVREIWRQDMILDLAHASAAVIAEVAAMVRNDDAASSVVVSHTGLQRVCDRDRNLSDEDVHNVVRAGGVIGLGYWSYAACWSLDDHPVEVRQKLVDSFVALYDILNEPSFREEMGPRYSPIDHIGLGSDFDGATTMPFDTTGIPWLLEGLGSAERDGRRAFDDAALAQIAGSNFLRLLSSTLY